MVPPSMNVTTSGDARGVAMGVFALPISASAGSGAAIFIKRVARGLVQVSTIGRYPPCPISTTLSITGDTPTRPQQPPSLLSDSGVGRLARAPLASARVRPNSIYCRRRWADPRTGRYS